MSLCQTGVSLFCVSSWSKFFRFSISYCTCLGGKVGDSTEVIYPRPKRESMIYIFTMWFMSIVKFHADSLLFTVHSPVEMTSSNIFIKFCEILIHHNTVPIQLLAIFVICNMIRMCFKKQYCFFTLFVYQFCSL